MTDYRHLDWGVFRDQVVPARAPEESITEIRYRILNDEVVEGRFRHRDDRIWTARITARASLELTSDGCRPCRFTSSSTRDVGPLKTTAMRFANMSPRGYYRITADALGTTTHPRDDRILVCHVQEFVSTFGNVPEMAVLLGRYDDEGRIDVFPNSVEIHRILQRCCPRTVSPVVAGDVNAVTGARVQPVTDDRVLMESVQRYRDELRPVPPQGRERRRNERAIRIDQPTSDG